MLIRDVRSLRSARIAARAVHARGSTRGTVRVARAAVRALGRPAARSIDAADPSAQRVNHAREPAWTVRRRPTWRRSFARFDDGRSHTHASRARGPHAVGGTAQARTRVRTPPRAAHARVGLGDLVQPRGSHHVRLTRRTGAIGLRHRWRREVAPGAVARAAALGTGRPARQTRIGGLDVRERLFLDARTRRRRTARRGLDRRGRRARGRGRRLVGSRGTAAREAQRDRNHPRGARGRHTASSARIASPPFTSSPSLTRMRVTRASLGRPAPP